MVKVKKNESDYSFIEPVYTQPFDEKKYRDWKLSTKIQNKLDDTQSIDTFVQLDRVYTVNDFVGVEKKVLDVLNSPYSDDLKLQSATQLISQLNSMIDSVLLDIVSIPIVTQSVDIVLTEIKNLTTLPQSVKTNILNQFQQINQKLQLFKQSNPLGALIKPAVAPVVAPGAIPGAIPGVIPPGAGPPGGPPGEPPGEPPGPPPEAFPDFSGPEPFKGPPEKPAPFKNSSPPKPPRVIFQQIDKIVKNVNFIYTTLLGKDTADYLEAIKEDLPKTVNEYKEYLLKDFSTLQDDSYPDEEYILGIATAIGSCDDIQDMINQFRRVYTDGFEKLATDTIHALSPERIKENINAVTTLMDEYNNENVPQSLREELSRHMGTVLYALDSVWRQVAVDDDEIEEVEHLLPSRFSYLMGQLWKRMTTFDDETPIKDEVEKDSPSFFSKIGGTLKRIQETTAEMGDTDEMLYTPNEDGERSVAKSREDDVAQEREAPVAVASKSLKDEFDDAVEDDIPDATMQPSTISHKVTIPMRDASVIANATLLTPPENYHAITMPQIKEMHEKGELKTVEDGVAVKTTKIQEVYNLSNDIIDGLRKVINGKATGKAKTGLLKTAHDRFEKLIKIANIVPVPKKPIQTAKEKLEDFNNKTARWKTSLHEVYGAHYANIIVGELNGSGKHVKGMLGEGNDDIVDFLMK